MNITNPSYSASRAPFGRASSSLFRSLGLAAVILAAASSIFAQDDRRKRGGDNGGNGGDRGNSSPQDMQARMMSALRERFGVTNDDEWAVISDRLTKVSELRRASGSGMGAMMFGRGGPGGGDSRGGGDRSTSTRGSSRSGGSNDVAALQAAIQDKLPEAEIKARLDRVRELRKENEAKLVKAQEDLRAVLSVRQEAIAVLAGLLQ
jgi:hypothetical protein